jgi:hypothetical protein
MTHGLGRLAAPDDRDRQFMLSRPREAAQIERRYWITDSPAYDQGATSMCCSYAWQRWLTTSPVINEPFPFGEFYVECQRVDEWPGEDYNGTSVRAGAKLIKDRGLATEYRWCWDIEIALAHLLAVGPLVLGTDWYDGMAKPDGAGYIWPAGSVTGGHAYVAIGASRVRNNPDGTVGAVRIINSWGQWGARGRAWVTLAALDSLIRAQGECCAAIEVRAT